jgi:hypothetical protein
MFSIVSGSIKRGIGAILDPILARMILFSLARPRIKACALMLVFRIPVLNRWLHTFAVSRGLTAKAMISQNPLYPAGLTPRARIIYDDLKAAIELRNKGD